MPRTLFLVRHAQSANNALPESQRVHDPDITPVGVSQSIAVADWFSKQNPTQLYCSGFYRSLRTASYVAKQTRLTPRIRADLFEQGGCYSGYEPLKLQPMPGLGRKALEDQFPGWEVDDRITHHGWWHGREYETDDEANERARSVTRWMQESPEFEHQRSVCVIHADFKRLLLQAMLPDMDWNQCQEPFNTSVTQVEYDGRWQLVSYNAVSHLPIEWIT